MDDYTTTDILIEFVNVVNSMLEDTSIALSNLQTNIISTQERIYDIHQILCQMSNDETREGNNNVQSNH